jgi:hypothetical protein
MSPYEITVECRPAWSARASCPVCGWHGEPHGADLRALAESAAQHEAHSHVAAAHPDPHEASRP